MDEISKQPAEEEIVEDHQELPIEVQDDIRDALAACRCAEFNVFALIMYWQAKFDAAAQN